MTTHHLIVERSGEPVFEMAGSWDDLERAWWGHRKLQEETGAGFEARLVERTWSQVGTDKTMAPPGIHRDRRVSDREGLQDQHRKFHPRA